MTGTSKTLGGGSGAITATCFRNFGNPQASRFRAGANTINIMLLLGRTTLNINSSVTITEILQMPQQHYRNNCRNSDCNCKWFVCWGWKRTITFYNLTVGIAGTVTFSGAVLILLIIPLPVNAGTTLSINILFQSETLTNSTSGQSPTPERRQYHDGDRKYRRRNEFLLCFGYFRDRNRNLYQWRTNSVATNVSVGTGTTLNLNSSMTLRKHNKYYNRNNRHNCRNADCYG